MTLDALLDRCLADGRAAWPRVTVPDAVLRQGLAVQLAGATPELCGHPADLFVAAAAAAGDQVASGQVHERLARLARLAAHNLLDRPELDELVQKVAMRLLVGEGGAAPQIARYTGLGPLDAWLRAVALRAALSARRTKRAHAPDASLDEMSWLELPIVMENPGALGGHSRSHATQFRAAFEAAMAALTARERTLLRQHFIDGLSSEQLGRLYAVHRVTVYRWVAEAKQRVIARVRDELAAAFGGTPSEIDSLMRSFKSGFSVTIERVLALGSEEAG